MKRLLTLFLCLLLTIGCSVPQEKDGVAQSPSPSPTPIAVGEPIDIALDISTCGGFILPLLYEKEYPPRPESLSELSEYDSDRYYDIECYGYNAPERQNPSISSGGGAKDKHIIVILPDESEESLDFTAGAVRCAEHYGAELCAWSADSDIIVQNELIERAIAEFPDAIVFVPIAGQNFSQRLRRINEAGIPLFCAGASPETDDLRYVVGWVGRDEWDQARTLARILADKLDKKGHVAYLTLSTSNELNYPRLYGITTELNGYAPDIATAAIQSAPDQRQARSKTTAILAGSRELDAIVLCDASEQFAGVSEALTSADRSDIHLAAIGNAKQTSELVESGAIYCAAVCSYFDYGAAVIQRAALWFEGKPTPQVSYFSQNILCAY